MVFKSRVKKEDHSKLVAMADEGWGWGAIAKKFGITPTWAAHIVAKCKSQETTE